MSFGHGLSRGFWVSAFEVSRSVTAGLTDRPLMGQRLRRLGLGRKFGAAVPPGHPRPFTNSRTDKTDRRPVEPRTWSSQRWHRGRRGVVGSDRSWLLGGLTPDPHTGNSLNGSADIEYAERETRLEPRTRVPSHADVPLGSAFDRPNLRMQQEGWLG